MSGKGSDRRPMLVEVGQFESNWDKAFGKKDKMLREVNYDGMWQHSCTVEMGVMWIGKDETCNYCGSWEEDGQ
jgi:hypothetical protein